MHSKMMSSIVPKSFTAVFIASIVLGVWMMFTLPTFAYDGLIPCNGPECQACHFVQLGQNILTWFIKTMAAVIALVFAWGGLKMVMSGGSTEGVSEAKGMMTNAVIGFIILLASWLIINTVLHVVISKNPDIQARLGEGTWSEIQCVALPTRTTATPGGAGTGTGRVTVPTVLGPGEMTDAEARKTLEDAGIKINKKKAEGTSLDGMKKSTVQNIVSLQRNCGCDVIVTGGTESGHAAGNASHGSGNKYDVGLNDDVTSFIKKAYTPIGKRGDGASQYKDERTGAIYALESNHWDVLVP